MKNYIFINYLGIISYIFKNYLLQFTIIGMLIYLDLILVNVCFKFFCLIITAINFKDTIKIKIQEIMNLLVTTYLISKLKKISVYIIFKIQESMKLLYHHNQCITVVKN